MHLVPHLLCLCFSMSLQGQVLPAQRAAWFVLTLLSGPIMHCSKTSSTLCHAMCQRSRGKLQLSVATYVPAGDLCQVLSRWETQSISISGSYSLHLDTATFSTYSLTECCHAEEPQRARHQSVLHARQQTPVDWRVPEQCFLMCKCVPA